MNSGLTPTGLDHGRVHDLTSRRHPRASPEAPWQRVPSTAVGNLLRRGARIRRAALWRGAHPSGTPAGL